MTRTAASARLRGSLRLVRSATWLDLRAAWWTARGLRSLRSQLREQGLDARVTPPPQLPDSALPAVSATARCLGATCLERSLLLQEWLLAHGRRHTLIIGVPSPGEPSFIAHAWLEGHDPAADGLGFAQLVRLDPR